jgi:hypothetical protein
MSHGRTNPERKTRQASAGPRPAPSVTGRGLTSGIVTAEKGYALATKFPIKGRFRRSWPKILGEAAVSGAGQ